MRDFKKELFRAMDNGNEEKEVHLIEQGFVENANLVLKQFMPTDDVNIIFQLGGVFLILQMMKEEFPEQYELAQKTAEEMHPNTKSIKVSFPMRRG